LLTGANRGRTRPRPRSGSPERCAPGTPGSRPCGPCKMSCAVWVVARVEQGRSSCQRPFWHHAHSRRRSKSLQPSPVAFGLPLAVAFCGLICSPQLSRHLHGEFPPTRIRALAAVRSPDMPARQGPPLAQEFAQSLRGGGAHAPDKQLLEILILHVSSIAQDTAGRTSLSSSPSILATLASWDACDFRGGGPRRAAAAAAGVQFAGVSWAGSHAGAEPCRLRQGH
jgi:hypothetical protein